jgi:hypothetical protein
MINVIRQRITYSHKSLDEIEVIREYHIRNDSTEKIFEVILRDLPLMINLEVFDDDNRRLSFLPNREVKDIMERLIEQDKEGRVDSIKKYVLESGEPYLLWIILPHDRGISPDETRVIRLKYLERVDRVMEVKYSKFKLYNSRRIKITVNKSRSDIFDTFVNIIIPSNYGLEYDIKITNNNKELGNEEGFYKTKVNNILQVRIPVLDKDITVYITYDIVPSVENKKFFIATFIALYPISIIVFVSAIAPFNEIIRENIVEITFGLIGVSLAIIGLVKDPLLNSVKAHYLGLIIFVIISFILFII